MSVSDWITLFFGPLGPSYRDLARIANDHRNSPGKRLAAIICCNTVSVSRLIWKGGT